MIRVVNKRTHVPDRKHDILVCRGTPLGNPFDWRGFELGPEFIVGSRAEAIANYIVWLRERIREKHPQICGELNRIYRRAAIGEDLNLVCYCCPLDCHSSFIKEIIEEKLAARNKTENIEA